jgi:hypothetical protein
MITSITNNSITRARSKVSTQDTTGPHYRSISNIYTVFENLNMMWMYMWMSPKHITDTPV